MDINNIKEPKDIKKLNIKELQQVNDDLRQALLEKLSNVGGHNGPNLGVVELTVALHFVFDSPIDKIVFDISHQSYIHKMLTGRIQSFTNPEKYKEVSGYTNPNESKHDYFTIGHTATSISLASGLAKARDLKGDTENIIAIIVDGSLSGGEAFEGLNYVASQNTNFIAIVNDNDQSIAENHGGLYENLRVLRESKGKAQDNFFKSLGFEYIYIDDGHNLETLINTFKQIKDTKKPVVVHIHTIKGKGFKAAEENREQYHAGGPIDLTTGSYKINNIAKVETYSSITTDYLINKMKNDKEVSLITAGTPSVVEFNKEKREMFKEQFIDVGIAEEHEVAMASGMAKNNTKPVVAIYSTFMLRAYDQISSDLSLNNNPAVILVYGTGPYLFKDETHLGIFDIAMISNIPNLVYLAPTNKKEHLSMLEWAINQNEHPVAIKVPSGPIVEGDDCEVDYSKINKFKVVNKGSKVAIIATSVTFEIAKKVQKVYPNITLINPQYLTGLDYEVLNNLKNDHTHVITIEDGILDGGFGQKIASYYGESDIKIKNIGLQKRFYDRYDLDELLKENMIDEEQIIEYIKNIYEN